MLQLSNTCMKRAWGVDVIFLRAIGHPGVATGIVEKALLLDLQFKLRK